MPADDEMDGLVAIGGDLSPASLLRAYRTGVFPWFNDDTPILWWSPDPRGIFELDQFRISRRLARTLRSGKFQGTLDRDFAGVIRGCAVREEGTWITESVIAAYEKMFELGHAHSVEIWHDGALAGGVYGIAIGGFFAGESMFHTVSDASKVALAYLVEHLNARGYALFDVQFLNEHTQSLGASEIARKEYLRRLRQALKLPVTWIESSRGRKSPGI